jgi:hypothetical protein
MPKLLQVRVTVHYNEDRGSTVCSRVSMSCEAPRPLSTSRMTWGGLRLAPFRCAEPPAPFEVAWSVSSHLGAASAALFSLIADRGAQRTRAAKLGLNRRRRLMFPR